jgi:hypothetical protein
MPFTAKEETPDAKPSFEDLSHAISDLNYAKGQVKEWANRANAARGALESHEREQAKAQLEVDRFQAGVDRILKKLTG